MSDDQALADVAQGFCEDGEVVAHGIFLIQMIQPNGRPFFGWKTFGEPRISETVGLVEMVKHRLLALNEDDDDAEA